MTRYDNIILDFDGLLTNLEQEAEHVVDIFYTTLAAQLGKSEELFAQEVKQLKQEYAGTNTQWEMYGQPTARWDADPYGQATVLADTIYEATNPKDPDKTRNLVKAFRSAQTKAPTYLHPEAKSLVHVLEKEANLVVVTNSDPQQTREKLATIDFSHDVIGNAKKYLADPDYTQLPELHRHARIRRPHFHTILKQLEEQRGFTPKNTVLAGDIYEFDLALPQHLGYGTVLFSPHGQADKDIHAMNGRVASNYQELLTHLE